MIITLKDGSKKEYSEAKSVIDVAFDISEGLARAACAGEVDGEVVDLRTVLDKDCELNILTARDEKVRLQPLPLGKVSELLLPLRGMLCDEVLPVPSHLLL